jgi:hypothetical protein
LVIPLSALVALEPPLPAATAMALPRPGLLAKDEPELDPEVLPDPDTPKVEFPVTPLIVLTDDEVPVLPALAMAVPPNPGRRALPKPPDWSCLFPPLSPTRLVDFLLLLREEF